MYRSGTTLIEALIPGVTVVTLAGGIVITALFSQVWAALAFYLMALTAASFQRHRALMIASVVAANGAAIVPWAWASLSAQTSSSLPDEAMGVLAALWIATTLLVWNPGRSQVMKHLQSAFDQAPVGIAIVDVRGTVIHTNDAFATIMAMDQDALTGQRLRDLLGQEIWESIEAEGARVIRKEQPFISFEREFARADGKKVWLSIYSRLLHDATGGASYFVVQALDLTVPRETKHALDVSEARFRSIIENSGELMMIVDRDARLRYVNPIASEILEVDDGALVGRILADFISSSDRGPFLEHLERARRDPGRFVTQDQLRINCSDIVYVEFRYSALEDTPGIHGIVIIGRVITEKVAADQQLRNSQARFSTIFHASPDAMMIVRQNDNLILDFNTGFTRLLGFTREDAIGQTEASLGLWRDETEREHILEELQENRECIDRETLWTRKDGIEIYVEISLRYVEIDGELCTLAVGRDINDRRTAEMAVKESEEKFSRIFADSPEGIVIIRLGDGVVIDINDFFLNTSEFSRDEVVGHPVDDLPIFANRKELAESTQILMTEGSYQDYEFAFMTKSQQTIPALVSATIVELGGEPCALCIAKDIRAQRRAEEQLRQSEERFRSAFENTPIGMMLVYTDGIIFQANNFAAELLAYDPNDLPGTHISRLVPSEERKSLQDTLDQLTQRGDNVHRAERRLWCQNGLEIWTNFHVVLQCADDGSPLYFIVQIADITEMKHSQERMEQMAFYDTLTNLANRRLFSDRLEHAIQRSLRSGKSAALLYLDLDNFKRVNDTLGHEAGDELLREVANRLTRCVRRVDTVARPGGDEFTIPLYDINSPGDAGRVAEKILARSQEPITVLGQPLVVTPSIGITILPQDSVEPNVLTKNADLAMYRAKELGRNTYQYYSDDMNTDAVAHLKTENELRQALQRDEFELYFQPKVRLSDQKVVGVEALLRWNHPENGLTLPDEFLGIAEESGVIIDVGKWVIEQACLACQELAAHAQRPITVGVNISPRQFRDPDLVNTIRRCLRDTKLDAEQIELDITETMLIDAAETATTNLEQLHELGVRFAIDDFGTGYSSLNYLKKFPIDIVKVDKSFVSDIPASEDDLAITTAVIAMAHRLNMEVVAEGVETTAQVKFLLQHKCEFGQGFYFSKPRPLADILRIVAPNVSVLRS